MSNIYSFKAGDRIYSSGEFGPAFRVVSGSIRLDRVLQDSAPNFANVAIVGDLFGAEVLLNKSYGFEARALTDCEVMEWEVPQRLWVKTFARELINISQRQAEAVSLRSGTALERVVKLVNLIRHNHNDERTVFPSLKDISDMTSLTVETASRCISELRIQGILTPLPGSKGAKRRHFKVSTMLEEQVAA
jgi:CRP-like cAMP-binding protein